MARGKVNGVRRAEQVDLLVDRADNCVNLCEIKFRGREFVMSADDAQRLERKRDCFLEATGTRKAVFTTVISCHGVRENRYYHSVVDSQLTAADLFTPA